MKYLAGKVVIDNNGKILIPEKMLKKTKINKGDILEITATDNLIIIEKFEGGINDI